MGNSQKAPARVCFSALQLRTPSALEKAIFLSEKFVIKNVFSKGIKHSTIREAPVNKILDVCKKYDPVLKMNRRFVIRQYGVDIGKFEIRVL